MEYKYLLFGFYHYYPSGGMEDLILKFNNIEKLKEQFKYEGEDVYQLVNTDDFSYIEIDVDKLFDDKYDKYDVPNEKIQELIIKQIGKYIT